MTSATFYAVDNSRDANLLGSVVVRVFSSDGSSFITQGTTDSNGALVLELPDATYWVRFYKKGFSFVSKMLVIVDENETNEWVIEGADLTVLPPSRADGICRVSGFVIDAQGAPSYLPIVTFSLPTTTRVMGNNIIGTEKVAAQPDTNGYIEIELLQNAVYTVTMASISDEVVKVKVPASQACNITDLIYPRGKVVNLPTSVSATVGEYKSVAEVVASSGISLPDDDLGLAAADLVSFTYSSKKVTATVNSSNMITVKASEAGTYSVTVYAEYSTPDIQVTPVSIGAFTVVASD